MKNIITLDEQFGLNPQMVVEVEWDTGTVSYAQTEMDAIYAYVKEFSDLTLVNHTEGFGQVNSVKVVMFDGYGHFKDMFESNPMYNITATVKIRTKDDATIVDLFTGTLDDIEWHQAGKEFTFSVVSEPLEGSLGYTPDLVDVDTGDVLYDFYAKYLNEGETWPNVFGAVTAHKSVRLNDLVDVVKTSEAKNLSPASAHLNLFTGDILVDQNMTAIYSGVQTVYIFNKGIVLLATGTFTATAFTVATITEVLWSGTHSFDIPAVTDHYMGLTLSSQSPVPLKNLSILVDWENHGGVLNYSLDDLYFTIGEHDGLDIEFSNGGYKTNTGAFTTAVTMTKVFKTDDNNDYNNFTLPTGMQIYVQAQDNYDVYIVDSKVGTTVQQVRIESSNDPTNFKLIPSASYTVKETTGLNGGVPFWTPQTHPDCTYIEMEKDSFFRYYQDFQDSNKSKEAILIDCTAPLHATEAQVYTYLAGLIGLTVSFVGIIVKQLAWSTSDEEDIPQLLSDIAWQGARALRHRGTVLEVLAIQAPLPVVDPIGLHQIQLNQVKIKMTPFSDIVTQLSIEYQLADMSSEVQTLIQRKNVALYKTIDLNEDIYIFDSIINVTNSSNYWLNRYADPEYLVEITGSLDLMKYESWDRLIITLPIHLFSKEGPLLNQHTVTDEKWALTDVIVKESSVNFDDLSVTLLLRANIIVGTL